MLQDKDKKSMALYLLLVILGVAISIALMFVTPYVFVWLYIILVGILLKEDSLSRKLKLGILSDKWLSAIVVALFAMQFAHNTQISPIIMWHMGGIAFCLYLLASVIIEKSERKNSHD